MSMNCEVVRDLLPLYADDACSKMSRDVVDEHLAECAACREMLRHMKESEIDSELKREKNEVIRYGEQRFRRRTALIGSVIACLFMIPILVSLIVAILRGTILGPFFIVLSAMLVASSLIIVPLMVPEDKGFWTFCAFTASLLLLFGVVCLCTGGNWFYIASSAVLFGLSVIFLPFLIRTRPLQGLLGNSNRALVVLGTDAVLFANMLSMIRAGGKFTLGSMFFGIAVIAGMIYVAIGILRGREKRL